MKAEISTDPQNGPLVRVTIDGVSVAIYLMDETAIATSDKGQNGMDVSGDWPKFKGALKTMCEHQPRRSEGDAK